MPLQQFDERQVIAFQVNLGSTATPGTFTVLVNLSAADAQIDSLMMGNTDTVDHVVTISRSTSAISQIGSIKLPAGAGNGTVPLVDAIAALQPSNHPFWRSNIADILYWTCDAAPASGKLLFAAGQGGYF